MVQLIRLIVKGIIQGVNMTLQDTHPGPVLRSRPRGDKA